MGWERYVPDNGLLRGRREELGLRQEEVAERAGIKLEQYRRFESAERQASFSASSLRIVNAVLTALELDPTAFANGEYAFEALPDGDPLNKPFDGEGAEA
jgi:transcriptional regulator with XRE-family HTH domain